MRRTVLLCLIAFSLFFSGVVLAMSKAPKKETVPSKESINQLPKRGCVSDFDISPDGKELIVEIMGYQKGVDPSKDQSYRKRGGFGRDLWRMDIDGKNVRRLTFTEFNPETQNANRLYKAKRHYTVSSYKRVDALWERYLPDGKHIAYCEETEIYTPPVGGIMNHRVPKIIDREGNPAFTDVPFSGSKSYPKHPVFSPDMRYYAYLKEIEPIKYKHEYQLKIVELQSKKEVTLEKTFRTTGKSPEFIWSPDGSKLAIVAGETDRKNDYEMGLWLVNSDGREFRKLTWAGAGFNAAGWSLRGKKLVFGTGSREKHLEEKVFDEVKVSGIWTLDLESNKEYKVSDSLRASRSCWSIDGKKVLFSSSGFLGSEWKIEDRGLHFSNSDGTNLKQIISGVRPYNFTWVLGDEYIVYCAGFGPPDPKRKGYFKKVLGTKLWLVSLDGKTKEELTQVPSERNWKYSPANEKIFYVKTTAEKSMLFELDLRTREKRVLITLTRGESADG